MGNYKRKNYIDTDSGIYSITNIINDKKYIGQTYSIKNRWYRHKQELENNTHHNKHLQYAWNKYGQDSFLFSILELCGVDNLNERETYWIKKLNSFNDGYNLTSGDIGCRGYVHTQEELQKMRQYYNPKPIYQLNSSLNLLKEWESSNQASTNLHIYKQTITDCCEKKNHVKSAGGFIWVYKEDFDTIDKEYYLNKNISKPKKIGQFDENLNIIKIWESGYELDKSGYIGSVVSNVCNHKRNSHKGFIWAFVDEDGKFIDDYDYTAIRTRTIRPVNQYDLNGNYITHYNSIKEASVKTGFDKNYISDVCNLIRKSYKNYIWKFA